MQWGVALLLGCLVNVGTLSDQDSNHIKITLFGSFPNDSEANLGRWILANIECCFVLTVYSIAEFRVSIC
jgi:hypothetical protein